MRFRKDCKRTKPPSNQQDPIPTPNQSYKMTPNPTKPTQQNKPSKMKPNSKPNSWTTTTTRTSTTTPKPLDIITNSKPGRTPKPVQIDNGFLCKNSINVSSKNGQKVERDFDYFALSMNWPETSCRFLMTKGKTCNIPG